MDEYLLSINDYDVPTIAKNKDAIYFWLIRLLLLNPGTIESHPEMGVGLVKNWRFGYMDNISELKLCIEKQIAEYLPQLQEVSVTVEESKKEDKEIDIAISIQNTLYSFTTSNGVLSLQSL